MTRKRDQRTHDYLIGTLRTITNPARTGFGFVGHVTKVMYLPHNTGTDIFLRFWDAEQARNYQALLDDTRDGAWTVSEPVPALGELA